MTATATESSMWAGYIAAAKPVELRNRIAVYYMPLLRTIAVHHWRKHGQRTPMDEYVSHGALGLLRAVERYKPGGTARFTTFAQHRIKGAILDGFRDEDWVPRLVRVRVARAEAELDTAYMATGVRPERSPREAIGQKGRCRKFCHDNRPKRRFSVKAWHHPAVEAESRSELLEEATRGWSREDRMIVALYADGLQMREIGRVVGVSESMISYRAKSLMARLRAHPAVAEAGRVYFRAREGRKATEAVHAGISCADPRRSDGVRAADAGANPGRGLDGPPDRTQPALDQDHAVPARAAVRDVPGHRQGRRLPQRNRDRQQPTPVLPADLRAKGQAPLVRCAKARPAKARAAAA